MCALVVYLGSVSAIPFEKTFSASMGYAECPEEGNPPPMGWFPLLQPPPLLQAVPCPSVRKSQSHRCCYRPTIECTFQFPVPGPRYKYALASETLVIQSRVISVRSVFVALEAFEFVGVVLVRPRDQVVACSGASKDSRPRKEENK